MEEEKNIPTVDPWEYLQMSPNPDGTITRRFYPPTAPPSAYPSATTTALSKDLPINHQNGTYVRLYLPKFALNNPEYYNKLPIVVYYHGGGLVILHADSKVNHDFCEQLAATAAVLVASVEYRLAPEHRLPAAYDDATDALTLIKHSEEDWISRLRDGETGTKESAPESSSSRYIISG